MPLMREQRVNIAGVEISAAVDARRAERLKRSNLWRYVGRPSLEVAHRIANLGQLKGRRTNGHHPAPISVNAMESATRAEYAHRVSEINWYHTIDLGNGLVTPGAVDCRGIARECGLPADLTGKRVLDVGTCDGFWAFEMERRGAAEVVATDIDSFADYDVPRQKRDLIVNKGEETLAEVGLAPVGSGFKLAHEILGSKVKREIVNVYELSPEKVGMFDVVFVGYLLVHLRDPQTALENIFSVARDRVVVVEPVARDLEGLDRPVSSFVGTSYLGIWWEHNTRSWELMMHTAGFERIEVAARAELDFQLGPGQDVTMSTVALRGRVPRAHELVGRLVR